MIVMKFGGSSLATVDRIRGVASIIQTAIQKNSEKPIVVLSALGDTTDYLLTLGSQAIAKRHDLSFIQGFYKNICDDLGIDFIVRDILVELSMFLSKLSAYDSISPEQRDYLVSFGERMTVRVFSEYLNSIQVRSKYLDAWDIGFRSDANFGHAALLPKTYSAVSEFFKVLSINYSYTPIVTGFIAQTEDRRMTTLGRGGSDLTATVIGNAIRATEIQLWKDVDGILTANPNYIRDAKSVVSISYDEAAEMALLGAGIIQTGSMRPAMEQKIPIRVKNSYNPAAMGTVIGAADPVAGTVLANRVKTINLIRSNEKKSILSLVGQVLDREALIKNAKAVFLENKIPAEEIQAGNSDLNISFAIEDQYSEKAYELVHRYFFN